MEEIQLYGKIGKIGLFILLLGMHQMYCARSVPSHVGLYQKTSVEIRDLDVAALSDQELGQLVDMALSNTVAAKSAAAKSAIQRVLGLNASDIKEKNRPLLVENLRRVKNGEDVKTKDKGAQKDFPKKSDVTTSVESMTQEPSVKGTVVEQSTALPKENIPPALPPKPQTNTNVTPPPPPPPLPPSSNVSNKSAGGSGGKDALLKSIQEGKELKKVNDTSPPSDSTKDLPTKEGNAMSSAIDEKQQYLKEQLSQKYNNANQDDDDVFEDWDDEE